MRQRHEHPFYGHTIIPRKQKDYINNILKKYKGIPLSEELKKTIWNELQMEKHAGNITIPFKMIAKGDAIEIVLDTKV